jgi:hypothetical protein
MGWTKTSADCQHIEYANLSLFNDLKISRSGIALEEFVTAKMVATKSVSNVQRTDLFRLEQQSFQPCPPTKGLCCFVGLLFRPRSIETAQDQIPRHWPTANIPP